MEKDWLGKIVQDDELGLLEIRSRSSAPTADEHLVNGFNQINEFLEANQCEPKADMGNVSEFMLHKRLESIRANTGQCLALKPYDEHNLLPELEQASEGEALCVEAPKEISSLEEWCDLHREVVKNHIKQDYSFCEQAISHLMGKFKGELDSYYKHILTEAENSSDDVY